MKRVCINKSTGILIEMQAGGDDRPDLMEMRLNTLLQNAISQGYKPEEVIVRWAEENEEFPTCTIEEEIAQATEKIIQEEMQDIVREMAITRLQKDGIL